MVAAHSLGFRRQSGVVLLSVLLIVALLSAITIRLVSRHSLNVAQSSHSIGSDLTLGYALGAETFARQLLHADETVIGPGVDNLTETWAQPLPPFPLEEYNNAFMEIQLRDLHSCFNLNSLGHPGDSADAKKVRKDNRDRLKKLLNNLSLPISLADAWQDWVDVDQDVTDAGAESGAYLLQDPAYRSADQPAAHVTEFALLAEIEPEDLAKLLPYVCVFPSTDLQLNVNTAPMDVLNVFNDDLVPISDDPPVPVNELPTYAKPEDFIRDFPKLDSGKSAMTTYSQFFELQTRVQIDGNITELTSVLKRDEGTGLMRVISRDLGKIFRSQLEEDEN